jgi:DNA polymerase-3 subunit alpha
MTNFDCGCSFDKINNGIIFDIKNIPLNCSKTWDLIGEGNTKGVFQLESRLGQSLSKKLRPNNIEQLSALISIMRPGCLEAIRDGKTVSNHYIDKKNEKESVDYFHSSLEPILKTTYGEMVYQEQAMEIVKTIAGFNLQEADMLRKAIGKKKPEEMAKIKEKFILGCKNLKTVNENEAEQIFSWIEKSQRYSFNKSHAVSYAFNAYLSAYAKAHFPQIFFLSYLRLAKDKIDPHLEVLELINNAKEMNINIFGPNIIYKNKEFLLKNNNIYFGLTNIKGLGDSVYNKLWEIIKDKNLEKYSWTELLFKVLYHINSTAAKALILSGCLDYLKISRTKLLYEYNLLIDLTTKELNESTNICCSKNTTIEILQEILRLNKVTKNRKPKILSIINQMQNPSYGLNDDPEWLANNEKELLGAAISCTKTDSYDSSYANVNCKDIKFFDNNKHFFLVAEITNMNIVLTKKGANAGQEMCFLNLCDSYGCVDVVVFPETFKEYKELLNDGRVLMFNGQKSKKDGTPILKRVFIV